jgi:hypothetical protein
MHVTAAHGNLGPAVCTVRDRLAVTRERYRLLEARHQKCLHSPEKGWGWTTSESSYRRRLSSRGEPVKAEGLHLEDDDLLLAEHRGVHTR